MNAIAEKTLLTAEEFLSMPDGKGFELVEGDVLERNVSVLSSWIGANVVYLIHHYVNQGQSGWVFGAENGIQCFANWSNTVRKPDVSFVKAERLSWDQISEGWLRIVPDLVVEVISPNDLTEDVEEKVEMFYKAGVPLIWVISPTARTVRILRSTGATTMLRESEELSGEDVLPGFGCPVSAIFRPRVGPAAAPAGN